MITVVQPEGDQSMNDCNLLQTSKQKQIIPTDSNIIPYIYLYIIMAFCKRKRLIGYKYWQLITLFLDWAIFFETN